MCVVRKFGKICGWPDGDHQRYALDTPFFKDAINVCASAVPNVTYLVLDGKIQERDTFYRIMIKAWRTGNCAGILLRLVARTRRKGKKKERKEIR